MRNRKKRQNFQKRKEYIQNITNKAFARARGVLKNFNWQQGMKCYHQDYVNCLLQYNEEVSDTDSRVIILTAPDNIKFPPGREVRVKTKELITLLELQTQISLLLDEDSYGEETIASLVEELKRDMKNNFVPITK